MMASSEAVTALAKMKPLASPSASAALSIATKARLRVSLYRIRRRSAMIREAYTKAGLTGRLRTFDQMQLRTSVQHASEFVSRCSE